MSCNSHSYTFGPRTPRIRCVASRAFINSCAAFRRCGFTSEINTITLYLCEPPGGRSFQVIEGICPFEVVMHGYYREYSWRPGKLRLPRGL